MRNENKFMPPGVEQFGFVENLAAFLQGQTAMTISWPPYGRWAAGYGTDQEVLSWVPKSTIAGKVGYALPPGGHPQLAAGFALSVASTSKNKDAAYLFIQWLNSEDISMQRVQLPYALRDPFRDSHFTSPEYLAKWPDAKDYLAALERGRQDRPARPVAAADRQVRRGAAPGRSASCGPARIRRRSSMRPRPNGTRSPRRSASTSRRPSIRPGRPSPAPIRNRRRTVT